MTARVHKTQSPDGTTLAATVSGSGPALVLVHGTTADHTRWLPVLKQLESRFTVYAVDRRGRGASGDAADYAIEREFEDLAALVDSISPPVVLLGHSYGALCALEAARRAKRLDKLILYEPPVPTGTPIYPPGLREELDALLAAGQRDAMLELWFRKVVKAPERELQVIRAAPSWQGRVAAAHTLPRELRSSEEYVLDPGRFAAMRVPTLLLLGSESPEFFKAAVEAVHAAVPGSRVEVLPGQQHTAMNTAPELFLEKVFAFTQ